MSFDPKSLTTDETGLAAEVLSFIAATINPGAGVVADTVVTVLRVAVDAFIKHLGDKTVVTPEAVRAELARLADALKSNDVAADAALKKKFGPE